MVNMYIDTKEFSQPPILGSTCLFAIEYEIEVDSEQVTKSSWVSVNDLDLDLSAFNNMLSFDSFSGGLDQEGDTHMVYYRSWEDIDSFLAFMKLSVLLGQIDQLDYWVPSKEINNDT